MVSEDTRTHGKKIDAVTKLARYDVDADRWSNLPDLPMVPALQALAPLWTGRELLVAGTRCRWPDTHGDESDYLCEPGELRVARFDPQANEWTPLPSPPGIRTREGMGGVPVRGLAVVSGHAFFLVDTTIWDLDIASHRWRSRGRFQHRYFNAVWCATTSAVFLYSLSSLQMSTLEADEGPIHVVSNLPGRSTAQPRREAAQRVACSDREVALLDAAERRVDVLDTQTGAWHPLTWPPIPGRLMNGHLFWTGREWLLLVDVSFPDPPRPTDPPVEWQHLAIAPGEGAWRGTNVTVRFEERPVRVADRLIGVGGYVVPDTDHEQVHGLIEWAPPI